MKQMNDDLVFDESDEYLLRLTSQLKDELQDIKVSEDLIARTMKKAKENQESSLHSMNLDEKIKSKEDTKVSLVHPKKHLRWLTSLAGVAAACFVLFIGSKVIFGGYSSKEDASSEGFRKEGALVENDIAQSPASSETSDGAYGIIAEESESEKNSQEFGSEGQYTTSQDAIKTEEIEVNGKQTTGTNEYPKVTVSNGTSGDGKEISGISLTAYEDAIMLGANEEQLYVYQKSDSESQNQALLELFSSEELKLTTEEVTDTWTLYIILSMKEESAILYRIGNEHQVVANIYESDGKSEDIVYRIDDMNQFMESLKFILN